MTYAALLRQILAQLKNLKPEVSVESLEAKPDPHRWSHKEILSHLIDSAYNNHQRFLRAASQPNLVFQGYAQDDWVKRNRYQERPLEEVISLMLAVQEHLACLIEGLPESLLQRKTRDHNLHLICMNTLAEGEPTSLGYLIWDYLFHVEHHLRQIFPSYRPILPPFEG